MDARENNNEPVKSAKTGNREAAFIFGSWKCRNPKKIRVASKDIAGPESLDCRKNPRAQKQHEPTLPTSSSGTYNSYGTTTTTEEQNEGCPNATTTRRALAASDQLNEQDFWCPRCNGKMEEPRLLPCLHSVCTGCVDDFMSKDYCYGSSQELGVEGRSASCNRRAVEGCPLCDFPLPKYGSSPPPPPHYPLQHRLVIYAVRRRLSQRAVCCDACADEVQATQHCPACLCNFCDDCGPEHEAQYRSPSPGRGHATRPLWEASALRRVAVCLAHPAHPLRFHCLACQMVTCKECMWRGTHRGHASEEATSAGSRAALRLAAALRRAKKLLNSLLTEYSERVFEPGEFRARTALDINSDRDRVPRASHARSRSSISSHSREARERIQEYSRLRRARHLIDAIFVGEDLLANGSNVEILSLELVIAKRLRFLGVPVEVQVRQFEENQLEDTAQRYLSLLHVLLERRKDGSHLCLQWNDARGLQGLRSRSPGLSWPTLVLLRLHLSR
ncbi:tripartite motif-containing protein 45 isoform X2 [Copidosoma floridanum]|uniref:tripartite motif-containing protein 45 isoform X2 n=1 Tax=Copidosoma floridanum TaxID=29053 RepID=UPI000C6F8405|nr:tripartite motif-containing protein 45 isoform X2 [Copidosoma floridanum]